MASAFAVAQRARGQRVLLPGYFASPVTIEDAEPASDEIIYVRVRTASGSLDELPIPGELLDEALRDADAGRATIVDPNSLFLLVESARIRLAYAHDPYFAVSLSGVTALPHQLEAVYERMLPQSRLRFLLAHDPGAGKTIMAGLLIKELKLRGVLDRVLIVCPAPLTIQWYDEMLNRFEERFRIIGADLIGNTLGGNVWEDFPQAITSLDFAKQPHIRDGILRAGWDLVVIDEAHKCSARTYGNEVKKTKRYEFGEAISRETDRLLLMTATPHQGDADQFEHFLRLLDADQFTGLEIDRDIIAREDSPWFSRRIKDELRDFDGNPLFPPRRAITQPFELSIPEGELYAAVTEYINEFLPGGRSGRRRNSVALARTVLQRRLASSLGAIEATLVRRRDRFADAVADVEQRPPREQEQRLREVRMLDWDDEIDLDDEQAEEQAELAAMATAADRLEDMRREVTRLEELVRQAEQTRETGQEAKLEALRRCLERAEFAELEDARGRLLIFTEYRATQDYLVQHLERWGYTTCVIHGGMNAQQRKEAQRLFQTERKVCVATEAAGEGINLQFCRLMINYDLPWNPNRLEQRMGRIHRIGQQFEVTVFNFVAENTIEGRIMLRLLAKLDEIKRAMGGSDRVFDVIGTLLDRNELNLESMLREAAYNPTRIDEYEAQIDAISYEELRRYEEAVGIALAERQVDLDRVRPKDWRSEERRLMPEFVERFFITAAERTRLRIEPRADGLWRVEHVPQRLRAPSLPSVQRFGPPEVTYRKLTFHKAQLSEDKNLDAELLSPGHPLFAATTDVLEEELADTRQGCASFIDPTATEPYRLYFFELSVLGERPGHRGRESRVTPVHAEVAVVIERPEDEFELAPPDVLHDLTPAASVVDEEPPTPDDARRVERWLQVNHTTALVATSRRARAREVAIRREYVERSFHELIKKRRNDWTALAARVAGGEEAARLARDEAQRGLEETERRRDAKLAELRHLEVLRPGPAAHIGSAIVTPVTQPEIARIARADVEVERIAVDFVMAYERQQGRDPEYIGDLRDGSGFDIRSVRTKKGLAPELRRIEVKGRAGDDATVMLSTNEWIQAGRQAETYWLYVVTGCGGDAPHLHQVQDPVRRLGKRAERLTEVKGYVLPGDALRKEAQR